MRDATPGAIDNKLHVKRQHRAGECADLNKQMVSETGNDRQVAAKSGGEPANQSKHRCDSIFG